MQTYAEYLATMRAYNFQPLDRATWNDWQAYYAAKRAPGAFKHERVKMGNPEAVTIALSTLLASDGIAKGRAALGGMSKPEARDVLTEAGWSAEKIAAYETEGA